MIDTTSDELRTLIERNRELERRVQELQRTISMLRANFEEVVSTRMKQLDHFSHQEA